MGNNTQENNVKNLLNKIRPSRLQAIEIGVVTGAFIIAVMIRILPLQYGAYFTAFDPLFQYRATQYIVDNGYGAWNTWIDTLSWHPMGSNVSNVAFPGVPFTAAFIFNLLTSIGFKVTLYNVCLFFPVFMGGLACVAMYFLAKEVAGIPAGLFGALFFALTPSFIHRTALGFFDTENIGIFAMILTSLFYLRACNKKYDLNGRIIYGILSGLSMGYIFASWGAAKYMVGLLLIYMVVLISAERYDTRHLIAYCLTISFSYLIALGVQKLGTGNIFKIESIVAFGFVLFMLAYEAVRDKLDIGAISLVTAGLLATGIISIFALPAIGIDLPLGFKFLKALNPFTQGNSFLYSSIAENHVTAWTSFFKDYAIILPLAIYGCIAAIRELDDNKLFAVIYFITGMYFAGVMSRLTQILSASACLIGAYGVSAAVIPHLGKPSETLSRAERKRLQIFGVSKRLIVVFVGFMLITMVPIVYSAIDAANNPTQLASSGISLKVDGAYPQDWLQAFQWMKENVADDEVICSWWDYGYWIEAMAGKKTMADGSTQTTWQISNIGKIMMKTPPESLEILEKYEADYILVFFTHAPGNPQQQWPFGDNVKWQPMTLIGGLDLNEYVNYTEGVYKGGFLNSTLVQLMYQVPTEGFEPTFQSENQYVLIYKVIYPENYPTVE